MRKFKRGKGKENGKKMKVIKFKKEIEPGRLEKEKNKYNQLNTIEVVFWCF